MKRFDSGSCPNCQTLFTHLPVERDGDSAYVVLETKPCAQCGARLCACCDQFHCDGCGDTFCADHLVSVPDGTPRPLHCCKACADECEPLELPAAPIPPQSETRAPGLHLVEVA